MNIEIKKCNCTISGCYWATLNKNGRYITIDINALKNINISLVLFALLLDFRYSIERYGRELNR